MGTALDRIRAATRELHERLDEKRYARSVLDKSLPIACYASFLRAVWVLHGELAQALELTQQPALRCVIDGVFIERRGLLENDLAHLKSDLGEVDRAVLQALVLAQDIRLGALREPARLLGMAYVLEGSQLGGLVQQRALQTRPELSTGGLSYLTGAGAATRARFVDFTGRLELALTDESSLGQAVAGAQAAFLGFGHILDAVDPDRVDGSWLATELNHEAGMHDVPEQLREVRAALLAGERSFDEVAYYQARYGERGRRYTRSDSAWLVTLSRESEPVHALNHVHWLARVLAARGMPRILLEWHLVRLHEALLPGAGSHASYDCLKLASEQLRRERYDALSDFDVMRASFAPELSKEATIAPQEAATLALAAVADEKRGVAKAVSSLIVWLCDPARFSPSWIRALGELIERARAAA